MNDESRKHRPQAGDRNDNYVAENDQPGQKDRDRKIEKGEEKMEKQRKRDEGIGCPVSDERRLQCRLFSQIESQEKIEFHLLPLVSFRSKTRRARVAKMKCLVFEIGGFHLNREVVHAKTIVKFRAQLS